jgi:hypothetical protein
MTFPRNQEEFDKQIAQIQSKLSKGNPVTREEQKKLLLYFLIQKSTRKEQGYRSE